MAWSRRGFVKLLSGVPGLSAFPLLSRLAQTRVAEALPVMPRPTQSASPLRQGFSRIGYKMICWDLQFQDVDPNTLKHADAEKYAEAVAQAGATSHLVYAITNTGLALFKSQFLPKFQNLPDDFLGAYLEACRKRGIKTELYYSLGWQKTLEVDHPDWLLLDEHSQPVYHDTTGQGFLGRVAFLCFNSPFREFCFNQVKELADRYTFDAFDVDILTWFLRKQVCYNPYCLEKWKARTGAGLPRPLPQELYPEYLDFMADTYRSIYGGIKDQLKASGRAVPITHNWAFDYSLDDFVMIESNPHGSGFYDMSIKAKVYRAHAHGRGVQINPHRANNYVDYVNAPVPTLTWETAVAVSHNAGLMWCDMANIDGTIDPMAVRTIREGYAVADRLIPKVEGTVPYAEIGILFSERNQLLSQDVQFTDNKDSQDFNGANKLLTDLHWPFDVVVDEHLSLDELSRFQLLVIPALQYLSNEHRQIVLQYLERGGHVFFCGRCAVLNQHGQLHAEPEFGLVKIRETHAPRGYVKTLFPIDDERLKAANIATVEPDASLRALGHMIRMSTPKREGSPLQEPPYPLGETNLPVMVTGWKGKGQFTYVGYALFQEYLNQGLPVIGQAFTRLVGDFYQPGVWVEAPTVVEAIYNRLGNELRVSLVNGGTARPSFGSFINIIEVDPIMGANIVVRDRNVRRAVDLAGRVLPVRTERGRVVVAVPRLDQYDLVSLELS